MSEVNAKLSKLERAIGIRKDLPNEELIRILSAEAALNDRMLRDYYRSNPVLEKFINLINTRQFLPKDQYEKSIEEFYQRHPNYRSPVFQRQMFNSIRESLPAGAVVSVKGGFAILKTERRHGRSPNGTFPVLSDEIKDVEDFAHTKGSISESEFLQVCDMMIEYMSTRVLYETNRFIGQGELAIPVRLITDKPTQAAFSMNMFRAESHSSNGTLEPWTVLSAPSFQHPREERFIDGVFKFTDYKRRIILVGGTGYNGEIKKSMFGVANHIYPLKGHLSLHCSSVYNQKKNDTTLIFGLSGTGKSTVSSGVGGGIILSDDETAVNLDTNETFNLENGNYYKTGGLLSEAKVLDALENIPEGHFAIYENIVVTPNGHPVFSADPSNNGRVSIPLLGLKEAITEGMHPIPSRIIILSRDVNGILDPVNILSKEQIIYYLNLGYTSKTPGTELGINKPIPTYSKWEGGPFYDLKDEIILKAMFKFLDNNPVDGILLNSGEGGGPFGSEHNSRFPVAVTLELAESFMNGNLIDHYHSSPEEFEENEYLKTIRPKSIPGVSPDVEKFLNAKKLWNENGYGDEYDKRADELFSEFKVQANESLKRVSGKAAKLIEAGPR